MCLDESLHGNRWLSSSETDQNLLDMFIQQTSNFFIAHVSVKPLSAAELLHLIKPLLGRCFKSQRRCYMVLSKWIGRHCLLKRPPCRKIQHPFVPLHTHPWILPPQQTVSQSTRLISHSFNQPSIALHQRVIWIVPTRKIKSNESPCLVDRRHRGFGSCALWRINGCVIVCYISKQRTVGFHANPGALCT